MKKPRNFIVFLVVLLGGLTVSSCANLRTAGKADPTRAVIAQNSQTKVEKMPLVTSVAPFEAPVKVTNGATAPIGMPMRIQIQTNGNSHKTTSSLNGESSDALSLSHSNADRSWLWSSKDYCYATAGIIYGALLVIWLMMLRFETEKKKLRKKIVEQI